MKDSFLTLLKRQALTLQLSPVDLFALKDALFHASFKAYENIKESLDRLTYDVIGCAIEVHRILGPGLLESVYEKCFLRELELRGFSCQNQLIVPLHYKGINLDSELRLDVLVEDLLCVELKAQEGVLPVHEAILMSYMQMLEKPKGRMLNFHCVNIFRGGQKTFVNNLYALLPDE